MSNQLKIIFIDGECVLCNGFANWLMQRVDGRSVFISALQGQTSKEIVPQEYIDKTSTIVYFDQGVFKYKSTAVLSVVSELGSFYTILKLLLLIPRFIRDGVYDIVAKYRIKWFGKKDHCTLPNTINAQLILP